MAVFPCKDFTICPDPASPVANLSAEGSDGPEFLGLFFPFVPGGPIGGPNPPTFNAPGCLSTCESTISQADADLCAARQAFICAHGGGGGPGSPPPPIFFFSNLQACSVTCPDGSIFTFRALPGSFVDVSQAAADEQAAAYACAGAGFFQMCLSNIPGACWNVPYTATITTSHTPNPPYTFALISGSLPPGLALTPGTNSATISGTPTIAGNYSFTVQITDQSGNTMQRTYTLAVMQITNSPPPATLNSAYSFQFTVSGGTPPYTFTLEGALPAGLSMDANGLITGTPTTAQTTNFTITVSDASP